MQVRVLSTPALLIGTFIMTILPELNVSPKNIWEFRQNKPSRICRALSYFGVPPKVTAQILMAHGVYKWFAVRRDLIRLKNKWKKEISIRYVEIKDTSRGSYRHAQLLGEISSLEKCRKEVSSLCHSERWRSPDHDPKAMRLLQ